MASITELLDQATEALQAAHRAQRYDVDPCHEDFYAWGWALSEMAAQLAAVAVLLQRQVADYPARWELRDDAGMTPSTRISRCRLHLSEFATAAGYTSQHARQYHGEMSHVAVAHEKEVK